MVSPPDVFDTESARGHPRPVLYHLWTKVAARSCLIEEAPEPTAASARVPRPLTGLSPGWRRCRYYPLLDEVICPTVAPRLSWSSRTRAVDRTEYRYTPARELSRGQHTGLQRVGPAGVWELVLQLDPAMVEAPCAGRAVGALILSCIPTEPLPPACVININRLGWLRGEKLHRARCKTFSRAAGVARVYLCAQRCVALTEINLRVRPDSARTIQVVPTVFFCPPASPPALPAAVYNARHGESVDREVGGKRGGEV